MANDITTKCDGCIFANRGECFLQKETLSSVGKDAYSWATNGFCRHKRTAPWAKKLECTSKGDFLDKVLEEEAKITTIIVAIGSDLESIKTTIEGFSGPDSLVDQFIVVTHKAEPKTLDEVSSVLNKAGVAWSIRDLQELNGISNHDIVDESIDSIKNNWFIPVNAGYRLSQKQLGLLKSLLSFKKNSVLAFYTDENDVFSVVTNKFAFLELQGHKDIPWFKKVKTFDNWKTVCIKID